MVLTSCFQEFNILSKRSFSIVLAAVFVYAFDILKILLSFLFTCDLKREKKNHYFCAFFQSVDDLREVLEKGL